MLHHPFQAKTLWVQIAFSIAINWIVTSLEMVSSLTHTVGIARPDSCSSVYRGHSLPDKQGLRQGLILVGVARCIAMVLVWTGLAGGDNEYCAILVAINSISQMVLFAPLALLFLVVISPGSDRNIDISYTVGAKSVAVFLRSLSELQSSPG